MCIRDRHGPNGQCIEQSTWAYVGVAATSPPPTCTHKSVHNTPCVLCRASASKYAENNALGWRPIVSGEAKDCKFMSYRELFDTVTKVGCAMKATINCRAGTAIGMYAANSPEWMIAMKAVDFCGGMTVRHCMLHERHHGIRAPCVAPLPGFLRMHVAHLPTNAPPPPPRPQRFSVYNEQLESESVWVGMPYQRRFRSSNIQLSPPRACPRHAKVLWYSPSK